MAQQLANPIEVRLVAETNVDPITLASFAALMCYRSKPPELGELIDVENRLFEPGHHTTLEHNTFSFLIEGIAVGDITSGLHLCSQFYNSDQRSGRYCAEMFIDPDLDRIENYIRFFWPSVKDAVLVKIRRYFQENLRVYRENLQAATNLTKLYLKEERPFASDKSIDGNSPKIAQEQMRMFIPVIFPTGLLFSTSLIGLAAMHLAAWNPVTRSVTRQMVRSILDSHPEIPYAFGGEQRQEDWAFAREDSGTLVLYRPTLALNRVGNSESFVPPYPEISGPLDQLHFRPEMMDNNKGSIETTIELSFATMGQDQRHRTIRRSQPRFTGSFYLPPVPSEMGLEKQALRAMEAWKDLCHIVPPTLGTLLASYGAMVRYSKNGSFNAVAHEQGKRLCFCAQEEIYHLGRKLRLSIAEDQGEESPLLQMLEPHCYREGVCLEGARTCGRNRSPKARKGDYFPERRV